MEKKWGNELKKALFENWRLKTCLQRMNKPEKSSHKPKTQDHFIEEFDLSPEKMPGFSSKIVDLKQNLEGGNKIELSEFSNDLFSKMKGVIMHLISRI